MTRKDYYQILEIEKTATQAEIKKAYRKLALKWHPDKNGNSEESKIKFQEIGEAYAVLSNIERRKNYDAGGDGSSFDFDDFCEREQENFKAQQEQLREERIALTRAKFAYSWICPEMGHQFENPPLDSNLWSPYSNWMEKMRKCSDDEINIFVGRLWAAAEEFGRKRDEKWQKWYDGIGKERNKDNEPPQEGIPKPNDTNQPWQNDNNTQTPNNEDSENERKKRLAIFDKIAKKLSSKPSVSYSELDPNLWIPFCSWNDKVWKIKVEELENFKNQMLAAIDKGRENKRKENLHNIFEEAKNKSGPDLDEIINNAEQERGSQTYEDNKEKVRKVKEKRAAENPEEYRQSAQRRVRESMTKSEVNEQDLDDKGVKEALNKLNSSETREPSVIVESEITAIDGIEKVGVTKKLEKVIAKIQQALKTGAKEDVEEVKTKLLEFINNSNVYYQFVYNKRGPEIKSLLSKLENYSASPIPTTASPTKFPLKVVLPITAALFLTICLGLFVARQKRRKKLRNIK